MTGHFSSRIWNLLFSFCIETEGRDAPSATLRYFWPVMRGRNRGGVWIFGGAGRNFYFGQCLPAISTPLFATDAAVCCMDGAPGSDGFTSSSPIFFDNQSSAFVTV